VDQVLLAASGGREPAKRNVATLLERQTCREALARAAINKSCAAEKH
jgi:hypothetical protein